MLLLSASKAFEGFSVYCATKAAVRSFAGTWTVDLKHRKIRVNAISPGPIDTPGLSAGFSGLGQSEDQIKASLVTSIPLGRMGNPSDIAKAVSFLASDDSSFITGIEFFVDGGADHKFSLWLFHSFKHTCEFWSYLNFRRECLRYSVYTGM